MASAGTDATNTPPDETTTPTDTGVSAIINESTNSSEAPEESPSQGSTPTSNQAAQDFFNNVHTGLQAAVNGTDEAIIEKAASETPNFNQGEPGSFAARANAYDFGSIERRDFFDLGIGQPGDNSNYPGAQAEGRKLREIFGGVPESALIARDTRTTPLDKALGFVADKKREDTRALIANAPSAIKDRFGVNPNRARIGPVVPNRGPVVGSHFIPKAPAQITLSPFKQRQNFLSPSPPTLPPPSL